MDVFDLAARITLDKAMFERGLKEAQNDVEKSGSLISKGLGKIGSAAKTMGKVSLTAFGAASAAVVSLTKKAVTAYANYEQLVGGVETLFGAQGMTLQEYADSVGQTVDEAEGKYNALMQSQDLVMENARKAFKTAGVSVNEYMEQATSSAAAMVNSLNGDTVKAAELTDMAIRDMSDNANKMGTSMESIQNAYAGFSKQNFTINNLMSAA